MPPKTPSELKAQIEAQQDQPAEPGHERTAEGMEVLTPRKRDFLGNLEKLARPRPKN